MVSKQKQDLVHQLAAEIKNYPIIGVVNMHTLPAQQLQKMRKTLGKKNVVIRMARKRLIVRALEMANKPNINALKEKVKGMPALILTKDNPFALYATIQKSKSQAAAKPGQISPREIVAKAGPTNFAPGPIISELAAVGIKTKVNAGKLEIISDAVLVREGQEINQKVADTLKRLDIKPMEIGLDLVAVWENGLVFDAKHLHIDEAEYAHNITQAAQWAMNLAVEAAFPTMESTEPLLQKAFREAKAVGIEAAFLTEETRDAILAKSEAEAHAIQKEANL